MNPMNPWRGTRPIVILLVASGGFAAGCASSRAAVTPQQITETELAIQSAERAGAPDTAVELLTTARQSLEAARQASFRGDGHEASRRLTEAKAYAEAAESRARAGRLQQDAAKVRQEADELEARLREIQERTRNLRR